MTGEQQLSDADRRVIARILGVSESFVAKSDEAIWIAARRAAIEECARVCDRHKSDCHSDANMSIRTEFGKETALAEGYGAANCATLIRSLATRSESAG